MFVSTLEEMRKVDSRGSTQGEVKTRDDGLWCKVLIVMMETHWTRRDLKHVDVRGIMSPGF
jgi:ribosomal protein L25 (general stress protein Ctc)